MTHALTQMPPPSADPAHVSAGSVSIVATDASDRALMVRVVESLGHAADAAAALPEAGEDDGIAGPVEDGAPVAFVVCHRRGDESLDALIRAAAGSGGRILAFTDSDEEGVVVSALEAGARQVFALGESERVVRARLAAALRRPIAEGTSLLEIEPFGFDLARRAVLLHGDSLELSPREFDLAYYLFDHRGRVVTNAELLTSVWSLPQSIDSRRIDTAVCRVRRKMRLGVDSGWVLRRFRREGYGLYRDSRDGKREAATALPVVEDRRGRAVPEDDDA